MIVVVNNGIDSNLLELVGRSLDLSRKGLGDVVVFLIGNGFENVHELLDYGVDGILVAEDERLDRFVFEPYLRISERVLREVDPDVVLAPATTFGRTLLPALAASLRTGLTADCTDLDVVDGEFVQIRPAIGGNVMAHIVIPDRRPKMATVRPKAFPVPGKVGRKSDAWIEEVEVHDSDLESPTELLDFKRREGVNIQDADVIVTVGKGLRRKENVKLAEKLARIVGGAVGATRAVVDARWIPHDHQVGLSGKTVSPKVYMAFGVSGAVQHVAGMKGSELVIAVNKDRYAPIFQVSDIGIVADAKYVLEELIRRLGG